MGQFSINQYHGNYNRQRRTTSVRYIVVHYTGSGTSKAGSARANCIYFSGGNRNASAHYFIDDANIYEYANPSQWACWHVGDGHGKYGITNQNSVGIEVCSSGADFTQAEQERLRFLVGSLMNQFSVPASRVVRHYDASRKCCPAPYAPNGSDPTGTKWKALHSYITGDSSATTTNIPSSGIAIDGYWGKDTNSVLQSQLGTTVDGIISSQYKPNSKYYPAVTSGWEWVNNPSGSRCIVALQKKIGVSADGIAGFDTAKALQQYLVNKGYNVGSSGVDGYFGHDSTKALQNALNNNAFK